MFRLDEKTKQIIKTWPLTTVRRWAAAPNVFTLDFGDYQDQYYSVQTTEGKDYQDQYYSAELGARSWIRVPAFLAF